MFFDTVAEEHQSTVGELVWEYCVSRPETVFTVGSSGLEYAITDYLQATGDLAETRSTETLPQEIPTVIVSGSASPVTAEQIDWALSTDSTGTDSIRPA
ncbi:hypothetical protein ACFQL4_09575 [Halosimplex aquaticum]